jgi:hypothetical protein
MSTFTANPQPPSNMDVSWDYSDVDGSNPTMVEVQQTAPNGPITTKTISPPADPGSTVFTGLMSGATYTYALTIEYIDPETGSVGTINATTSGVAPTSSSPPPPPHATAPATVTAKALSYHSASVTWSAGAHLTSYTVSRHNVAQNTTVTIASGRPLSPTTLTDTMSPAPAAGTQFSYTVEAYNPPPGTSATSNASNTITMPLQVLSITPSTQAVVGGQSFTCQIALSSGAPSAGAQVAVLCSDHSVSLPGTVTVAAGADQSAPFTVMTPSVTTATKITIDATLNGTVASPQITLNALAPSTVSVARNPIIGGAATTGSVTMDAATPNAISITLGSNSASVEVPAAVTVAAGQSTSGSFPITTKSVSSETLATITASFDNFGASAVLEVQPLQLTGFTITPSHVASGKNATGAVTLSGDAPFTAAIAVTALPTNIAHFTSPVSIPVGKSSASFTLTATAISSLGPALTGTVTAAYGGISKQQQLIIEPPSPPPVTLAALTISPSTINGGGSVRGTVSLDGPAPSGGLEVGLFASSETASPNHIPEPPMAGSTSVASVPASVTVLAGRTAAGFTIETTSVANYGSPVSVTIGATAVYTKYALLTVT